MVSISNEAQKNVLPDKAILRKSRIMWMMALAQDPRRFYCHGISVTVEHPCDGPALQDKLTDFMMRQKSGL